jgi:1-acyl-sn-glycerol-3-phosphate acyltransferase
VLFPEGTSTQGSIVKSFHASLLSAPARLEFPVTWTSLRYETDRRDPSAHLAVCWWGDAPFVPHFVNLCGLRRIEAQVHFGAKRVQEGDRKLLVQLAISSTRFFGESRT